MLWRPEERSEGLVDLRSLHKDDFALQGPCYHKGCFSSPMIAFNLTQKKRNVLCKKKKKNCSVTEFLLFDFLLLLFSTIFFVHFFLFVYSLVGNSPRMTPCDHQAN